ncbi:hypothetical protein BH10CYA1_BH10CYA1_59920 [soil metagenome]
MPENDETKEFRRRQQQGLGKAVDSREVAGMRYVRVNLTEYHSKLWRTFEDFLFDYIKLLLTPEWAQLELQKPVDLRHPLMRWYDKLCSFQQSESRKAEGDVYFSATTGAVKAYLYVAYNLYLCAHNDVLASNLLVRLRHQDHFEGALYESYVIASVIKAGFDVELEDELDSTVSHCEFTAKHRLTGRTFSVEAKATTLSSERSGHGSKPPRVRDRLFKALKKKSAHERIIFIELNRAEEVTPESVPSWLSVVDEELRQAEIDFEIEGDPSAYVFVTNHNFMHWLDSPSKSDFQLAAGYRLADFPPYKIGKCTMAELIAAREKHAEILHLLDALNVYATVPSTFDERSPEEVFQNVQPPQVGEHFWIPDENGTLVLAELISGQVLEAEKTAYCQVRTEKGYFIATMALCEAEMAIYRRSPETFFGVTQSGKNKITEPHECFDFVYESYKDASKQALLKLIESWHDFHELSKLDQAQLARIYAERAATDMWLNGR